MSFSLEHTKAAGNEAFKVGDYAKAILAYTTALFYPPGVSKLP
jgi:hypothetical protein